MGPKRKHLLPVPGDRFGQWEVVDKPEKRGYLYYVHVACVCGCKKKVYFGNLYSGRSSCCAECTKLYGKRGRPTADGAERIIPEMSLRRRWIVVYKHMIDRCTNPACNAYEYYGGRGIAVCDKWASRINFLMWVVNQPYWRDTKIQIDRIDNDQGYSPENCRLVTPTVNMNNRSCNVRLTYGGESMTASEFQRAHLPEMSAANAIQHLRNKTPEALIEYYHTEYLTRKRC